MRLGSVPAVGDGVAVVKQAIEEAVDAVATSRRARDVASQTEVTQLDLHKQSAFRTGNGTSVKCDRPVTCLTRPRRYHGMLRVLMT